MKIPYYLIVLSFSIIAPGCATYIQELVIETCTSSIRLNENFSKAGKLRDAMRELNAAGVPGTVIALYTEAEGWWMAAEGYAKLEDKTLMESCHLHYLQSISKTYMAVAILKLYETGKIALDEPFNKYLPKRISAYLPQTDKISVRMLLNHTSGLPEYNFSPDYVTYLLQHPEYIFQPESYLGYIQGKDLDFEPGSKYAYRNTNYVLLAMIADSLTGNHAKYIAEHIFNPLNLTGTYYRSDAAYPNYPQLVNSYWDRYGNGIVENVSRLQRSNVASLIGDDGIVCTPSDAVRFLMGLMEGRLLADSTLKAMQNWVQNSLGNPVYGLGLSRTEEFSYAALGHSGGGIGAGCDLRYFPEKKLYLFVSINLGTVTDSPIHRKAAKARDKIYEILLK